MPVLPLRAAFLVTVMQRPREQSRNPVSNRAVLRTKEESQAVRCGMEGQTGIEPASSAWKAEGLPLTDYPIWQDLRVTRLIRNGPVASCREHSVPTPWIEQGASSFSVKRSSRLS